MVNVVVVKKNGSLVSSEKVVVKNVPSVPSIAGATKFDSLTDVDTSLEEDGSVLIYDAETDKYVVKPLELDGGEF